MKLIVVLAVCLAAASLGQAQTSSAPAAAASDVRHLIGLEPTNVRHLIGLDPIKKNATGQLTVQDGVLYFKTPKVENKLPVASIDDVFIGTETTEASSKKARVIKTAAIAAPYETGRALPILMRTKVDILTVSFHDSGGALHGAIFALPIGQAESMREQLIQAGAHASPLEK